MTQQFVVDCLVRSGWKYAGNKNGFEYVYKRKTGDEYNYLFPAYKDLTIFPNGRCAEGEWIKYPKKNRKRIEL